MDNQTNMKVDLYLEAHVTIEPVFDSRRNEAAQLAARFGFRLAELLMKKRSGATEERSDNDTFMTAHSRSVEDITNRTKELVTVLKSQGFKVWRYKIENTLIDSRLDDKLKLLWNQ